MSEFSIKAEYSGDGLEHIAAALGGVIRSVVLEDDTLHFTMADPRLNFYLIDNGQSCCESRYMTTDDALEAFANSRLIGVEVRDGGYAEELDEDGFGGPCHEVHFLVITTSKGAFTICTHNEHNGYYGGFDIRAVKS